jgi:hypothetical protein
MIGTPTISPATASGGQLPFRFVAMDAPQLKFYVQNHKSRPRRELAETVALMAISIVVRLQADASG